VISLFFFFLSFHTHRSYVRRTRSGILAYAALQFVKAAAITGTYITLHPSVVLAG
jgi:ABC-type dipeptide/oligopeptide/nickel transport system permease subunit